jgi:hypothetical protein
MTTSGSFSFDPSFANLLDEAMEQAGIDPASISQRHITSAKMSLNLMFTEWITRDGDALYRVDNTTAAISASDTSFTPASGTMDVIDIVSDYSSEGIDIPLERVSRQDYLHLADKDDTGRPAYYYVDIGTSLNTVTVYFWPVPDAACTFTYDYMRYIETAGALSETLDVHRPWLAAVASGLALRLARKFNIERVPLLEPIAEMAYRDARRSGSGSSKVVIGARGFGTSGRTLRR